MLADFVTYKVKIRPTEFITPEGNKFSNTAVISFFDINKKEILYKELGYIDSTTIYEQLHRGEDINLNYCYIEDFSMHNYRKKHTIASTSLVVVKSFMAKETIFNAVESTDFSYIHFQTSHVSFENAVFIHGDANFASSVFEDGNINFKSCVFKQGNIIFNKAHFGDGGVNFSDVFFGDGVKDFQYADFGNGDVLFSNTIFGYGDIFFINSNFGDGKVTFKSALFGGGKIDFHFAIFGKGDISFERTEFGNGRVDFRTVEFGEGKIIFNRAIFGNGEISFEGSEIISGRLLFKNTFFGNGHINFNQMAFSKAEINFEKAIFGEGNVSFNKSTFNSLSLKSCQLNHYFDFRVDKCYVIDLQDTVVRDIIDLTPSSEIKVDLHSINFSGMRLIGQIYLDWNKNKLKKLIYNQVDTTHFSKAEQFNLLKQNFHKVGKYNDEDYAYVEFKRNEEKSELSTYSNSKFTSKIFGYLFYYFKRIIFDMMGLYATSPIRVFISLLVILSIFTILHTLLPFIADTSIGCIDKSSDFTSYILTTSYYSAITFFTVGYGDCSPNGILRFIASALTCKFLSVFNSVKSPINRLA
ncbi:MAG: hypothetical protein K0B10_15790 [Vicingaceae bacterium]|nr:hypothetical protein [Vicingaceae bacterium]